MKALRLKLFQETACYKKPIAFKVAETYPLPPYSTVKGMLHSVIDAKEFIPMWISIQGNYDTLMVDYQKHYFFKKSNTNEFVLTLAGLGTDLEPNDISSMPIYTHMLFNVKLLIHVHAEEAILQQLKKNIINGTTHLSLGRWEDLVRVDECEIVNLKENEEEELELNYDAYIPKQQKKRNSKYYSYKLNWKYKIIENTRVWEKIEAEYVQKGETVDNYSYLDPHKDMVFFPVL